MWTLRFWWRSFWYSHWYPLWNPRNGLRWESLGSAHWYESPNQHTFPFSSDAMILWAYSFWLRWSSANWCRVPKSLSALLCRHFWWTPLSPSLCRRSPGRTLAVAVRWWAAVPGTQDPPTSPSVPWSGWWHFRTPEWVWWDPLSASSLSSVSEVRHFLWSTFQKYNKNLSVSNS